MSDSDDTKPEQPEQIISLRNSKSVTIAFKLNGKNYPLWSRLIKVKIGGRGAYSYIRKEPPEPGSKGFDEWEENDLVVFSWIVDNIENDIIADFVHHQTAKALWDSLAVTFENRADKYHIYDLEEKAINIKQGSLDLETYYRRIHGLWINIDRSQKQPISCCDKGIDQFRTFSNEKRLIKFLSGLNQDYDSIKRDILKDEPTPSVEAAYGWVKTEAARRRIMPPASSPPTGEAYGGSTDSSLGGGNRPGLRRTDPATSTPQRTTSAALRHHQSTGKQARYLEIMVLPLWKTEAHLGDLLQTAWIPRMVGRTTEGKGRANPSKIGNRSERRWSAAAD